MKSSRRTKLLELIDSKPSVTFSELSNAFPNVSEMTLRRDVEGFEKEGLLIRVRGGARSMKYIASTGEGSFDERVGLNSDAKEKIADEAVKFISGGMSLFLDSGTTALGLAHVIPNIRITVTTSGMNVALELLKRDLSVVNIVGGIINRDNITVSGDSASAYVSTMSPDLCFLVPAGVSKQGLNCGNLLFSELKNAAARRSKKVIALFDSSKLSKSFPYQFCGFEDLDVIITDKPLPTEFNEICEKNQVTVIIAK